ncbi:MAG: cupin domain-containing protein [Gammaproteobacteria bacterium]|nr:cupin domain-containing protein [Gammaproteobacteria bacterium]
MAKQITNIHRAELEEKKSHRGEPDWRCLDLGGEHLGVRIEELPPGSNSSYHHYHTAEEEHVLVLEGAATLHLGDETVEIGKGDHVLFPAGEEVAHHIENSSTDSFTYLVFGERRQDDVVMYPKSSIALVKSAHGHRFYTYEEYIPED